MVLIGLIFSFLCYSRAAFYIHCLCFSVLFFVRNAAAAQLAESAAREQAARALASETNAQIAIANARTAALQVSKPMDIDEELLVVEQCQSGSLKVCISLR